MGAATPAGRGLSDERIMSVDALRGFDMFWIIGADALVSALNDITHTGVTAAISHQLSHKDWEGFAFEDLIFPLFVFLAGVSLVFSLGKTIEREGKWAAYRRVFYRAVLLYLIGIFYYGGFEHAWPTYVQDWGARAKEMRLLGVLQRIALCYLFAGFAFCTFRLRGMIVVCVALLAGYWALMTFVPVPGAGAGSFVEGKNVDDKQYQPGKMISVPVPVPVTKAGAGSFVEGKNLANWVDKQYLPGRLWDRDHDPEGLLSTLPAIATCLLGVFAGLLLKNNTVSPGKKVLWLALAGIVALGLGFLWGLQFPIIKKIWTSSYVLVAGGYSALLLAFFYLVIDVWKCRRWALVFIWIGMNPITLYLAENFVPFGRLSKRFVGGNIEHFMGVYASLASAIVAIGLILLLARFLYRRKLFLRL